MNTQKHDTLNTLNAQGAMQAPVVAGRAVDAKAAKLAAKAKLDKLAKADVEEEIILAEAQVEMPVEVAMAEGTDASASGIGAMESSAAAEGQSVSPLLIGGGVLAGVAAIAALAGGSDSSSSSSNDNLQQKPPVDDGKKPGNDDVKPGPDAGNNANPPAGGNDNGNTGGGTGGNNVQQPAGPAQAEGPANAPKVAVSGETKLSPTTFFAGAQSAEQAPEFIKITSIIANENETTERVRLVRFGNDVGTPKVDPIAVKDPQAAAPEATEPVKMSAYEVIKFDHAITRAEAANHAQKLGGRLLIVENAEEAQWLRNEFANLLESGNAWIGDNMLVPGEQNAAVRSGDAKSIIYSDLGADKLDSYVLEIPNYTPPLTLNGKPVVEGQIIARGDFDKLSWNSDNNKVGEIKYVAVVSDEANAADVEGATVQTIKIVEDASVKGGASSDNSNAGQGQHNPDTPDGGNQGGTEQENPFVAIDLADQRVEHNALTAFDVAELKKGLAPGATHIEILQVHAGEFDRSMRVINWHEGEAGKQPTAYELVKLPNGEKLSLEAFKAKYPGMTVLNIGDDAESAWLANSLDATFDVARTAYHFEGKDAPAGTEVRNAVVFEYANYQSPLVLVENDGTATRLQPGSLVRIDSLDKIKWDSSLNKEGLFKFVAVTSTDGKNAEAIDGAKSYVLPVKEDVATQPIYPATNKVELDFAHDIKNAKIDASVFRGAAAAGSHETQEPEVILITEVADGVLRLSNGGPTTVRPLKTGDAVAKADFDKLFFDASVQANGSFKFKAGKFVVENGVEKVVELTGAPEQTVSIYEHPVVPTYADNKVVEVGHDKPLSITKDIVAGSANEATHVKIISHTGGLMVNGKLVKAGDVLTGAQLDQVTWDTKGRDGGSFTLQAMHQKAGAEKPVELLGSKPVTVTINEHPKVPDYSDLDNGNKKVQLVYNETGKVTLDDSVLAGKVEAQKPAFVKITAIPEALNGKLTLHGKDVEVNQVIKAADFDDLVYESTGHKDGTFKFKPVMDEQGAVDMIDATEQTVNMTFVAAPAATEVKHDTMSSLSKDLFKGSVPASTDAPKFVKITAIEPNKLAEDVADQPKVRITEQGDDKSAYQVVHVGEQGISLEAAKAAAEKMGGKLLVLDTNDELSYLKTHLLPLLDQPLDATKLGKDVVAGAWMTQAASGVNGTDDANPEATAADKEGVKAVHSDADPKTAADKFHFVELGTNTKMTAFVVEFEDYADKQKGLFTVSGPDDAKVATEVSVNDVLDAKKLETLSWDSMFNNGGKVTFVEVTNQSGDAKDGALSKTIVITEQAAAAPTDTSSVVGIMLNDEMSKISSII